MFYTIYLSNLVHIDYLNFIFNAIVRVHFCICLLFCYVRTYVRSWLGRLCQDFSIASEGHFLQIKKNKEKDEYVRSNECVSRTQAVQSGTHSSILYKRKD